MLDRRRDGPAGELRRLCQDSQRLLSARGDVGGLRQSFGLRVDCLYDLDRIEIHHTPFKQGAVARSAAVQALL